MLFNSIKFMVFFPCVFLLYYALPFRFRKYMLLAASYYFYMCWKPEFILLILFSTVAAYLCALGGERWPRWKKGLVAVSLALNLGVLFFFKYFNFFSESFTALCRSVSIPFSAPVLAIVLPVGISFYTFQTLSYTLDVYRGDMEPERDLVTFALFVSFFPQLVAGPIEKASALLPQLKTEHSFTYENAAGGLKLMGWGFFKKMVLADQLALLLVDPVYNDLGSYEGGALVLATCAFAVQIYCDFGGYSDIARGCARMMGVELMVNFRAPYFAASVTEFWRRWHISLTSWFREYVYIPLGGNRKGAAKKCLFVLITFTLSGLWHGAAWTFVLWGLFHALVMDLEFLWHRRRPRKDRGPAVHVLRCVVTFGVVSLLWIFFRANTMGDALYVLRHMTWGIGDPVRYVVRALTDMSPGMILAGCLALSLLLLFLYDLADERGGAIALVSGWPVWVRWPVYVAFVVLLVLLVPKEASVPFIYFQF